MHLKNLVILSTMLAIFGAAGALASPVTIRGTVVSLAGQKLTVHSREGADVEITLAEKAATVSVVNAALADVKPGSFVGVASLPQEDGSSKGLELMLFPENMRGFGEGHYPWDLKPKSSMTNATVAKTVKATDGQTLTLNYKGGEQKVTLPPDAPIVTIGPATTADLAPGAVVFIPADKMADGSIGAQFVVVGKNGVKPPM